jgi:hypothetical protein
LEYGIYVLFEKKHWVVMALLDRKNRAQRRWRSRAWIVEFSKTKITLPK